MTRHVHPEARDNNRDDRIWQSGEGMNHRTRTCIARWLRAQHEQPATPTKKQRMGDTVEEDHRERLKEALTGGYTRYHDNVSTTHSAVRVLCKSPMEPLSQRTESRPPGPARARRPLDICLLERQETRDGCLDTPEEPLGLRKVTNYGTAVMRMRYNPQTRMIRDVF